MENIHAKKSQAKSIAIANQGNALQGKSMPAVPVLQNKDGSPKLSGTQNHLPYQAAIQTKQAITANDNTILEAEVDAIDTEAKVSTQANEYVHQRKKASINSVISPAGVLQLKGDPIEPEEFERVRQICLAKIETHKQDIIKKLRGYLYDGNVSLTPLQVTQSHKILKDAGTNEVEYLQTNYLNKDNLKQSDIDTVNTFYENCADHLLPEQKKLVLNFLRRYGLNEDSAVDAYVDSLAENMRGTEGRDPRFQVSQMMLSINARLTAIGLPTLDIVYKKGLENSNSANFFFSEWKIQIDESLIKSFDAGMANTIYHEARHSEQFFKMIMMEQIAGKGTKTASKVDADIVINMGVPAKIVAIARAKQDNIDTNLPPEQRLDTYHYHESVYGDKRQSRTKILSRLGDPKKKKNYEKYKALPEEVDAWDTGGRVEKSIDKKIGTLARSIGTSENLDTVQELCGRLGYYIGITKNKDKFVDDVKKYLTGLKTTIETLHRGELLGGGDDRPAILKVLVKHNFLAQAFGLPKITVQGALGPDREFQRSDWAEINFAPNSIVN